jgi:hypothetical protein
MTKTRKIAFDKFLMNLLKFTAPILAIFFVQLAAGVDFRAAGLLALYALYAALADYFKKLG